MAFKKVDSFYENTRKKTSDVPFLSDLDEDMFNIVVNESWVVSQLYRSPKGLLVVTEHFKTFVFGKATLFEKLSDAVNNSVDNDLAITALSVFVNRNRTVIYGEDDDYVQSWSIKGSNYYATTVYLHSDPSKSEDEVPF